MKLLYASYDNSIKSKDAKWDHHLGIWLLQRGLGDDYGMKSDADELEGMIAEGLYGKPYFKDHPDIHFNISHSRGLVVCAFHDGEIGVDVELVRTFRENVLRRICTDKEIAAIQKEKGTPIYEELFFRYWTAKESYLKYTGTGLASDPKSVEFEIDPVRIEGEINCSDKGVRVVQKQLKNKMVLSICTERA